MLNLIVKTMLMVIALIIVNIVGLTLFAMLISTGDDFAVLMGLGATLCLMLLDIHNCALIKDYVIKEATVIKFDTND